MEISGAQGLLFRVRDRLLAASRAAARAQAAVLLTLVYFAVLGPVALLARLCGADFLGRRRPARSGWIPLPRQDPRESLRGPG